MRTAREPHPAWPPATSSSRVPGTPASTLRSTSRDAGEIASAVSCLAAASAVESGGTGRHCFKAVQLASTTATSCGNRCRYSSGSGCSPASARSCHSKASSSRSSCSRSPATARSRQSSMRGCCPACHRRSNASQIRSRRRHFKASNSRSSSSRSSAGAPSRQSSMRGCCPACHRRSNASQMRFTRSWRDWGGESGDCGSLTAAPRATRFPGWCVACVARCAANGPIGVRSVPPST